MLPLHLELYDSSRGCLLASTMVDSDSRGQSPPATMGSTDFEMTASQLRKPQEKEEEKEARGQGHAGRPTVSDVPYYT